MRLLIQLASVAMAASIASAAGPGYLATVGPPPLRFMEMPNTDVVTKALPPLLPTPDNEPASIDPVTLPSFQPPELTAAAGPPMNTNGPIADLAPIETTSALTNLLQSTSPEAAVISPQVWLKYFTGTTNATPGTSLLVPPVFMPPQPTAAPSSKSTYQIGP